MASEFSAAIRAQIEGRTVRVVPLVMFDFRSGPMRVWPGFGPLDAGGETWSGLAELGTMSTLGAGPGQTVEETQFSLAADETILGSLGSDAEESTGRAVNIYLQFFDVRRRNEGGDWADWQLLDEPFQIWWGIMGPLVADRPPVSVGEPVTRTIEVIASNAFINKARPAYSYFSHRDQQARHPGDNIFISASELADKDVRWPHFS